MSMFNPETMKNLMENQDIQKMMNDPKMMNNLQSMMGNMGGNDLFKGLNTECSESCESTDSCKPNSECCEEKYGTNESECGDINIENLENIDINESRLNIGDKIVIKNLKNEHYNNRNGLIEALLPNGRFVITIDDKTIALKEENLENIYENIENID